VIGDHRRDGASVRRQAGPVSQGHKQRVLFACVMKAVRVQPEEPEERRAVVSLPDSRRDGGKRQEGTRHPIDDVVLGVQFVDELHETSDGAVILSDGAEGRRPRRTAWRFVSCPRR
jgi:hypothetical protein